MNLTPIDQNLWIATQPQTFLGLEIGTRMEVVRLRSGELILISPIEMQAGDRKSLDELGSVRHVIAPNCFHHLYMSQALELFPDAMAWGVEGLPAKRPDLQFDDLLTEAGSFGNELDYLPFQGFASILPWGIQLAHETVFFHRASRSLILTDTAFNFDQTSDRWLQLGARVIGSYKLLKPSVLEKWGTREKETVKASINKVLAWDFDRVILAHGGLVDSNAKEQLKAGYEWFLNSDL